MPVPGGVEHREAPERLPDAAQTPWELRISSRSAGSRIGTNTLGRRLDAVWFAQPPRAQACEGKSQGESLGAGSGKMCSEGGFEALEPRPWDQGGWAQVS